MARQGFDVVVIGAGVVGLSCAYFAQADGRRVCVVDSGNVGQGASWGNAGLIPLSLITPLAVPGITTKALRWQLEPDGPFRLRPRLDPRLVRWLTAFRRNCTPKQVSSTTTVLGQLTRASLQIFNTLNDEERLEFDYEQSGTLAVCATENGVHELGKSNTTLREAGVKVDTLDVADAHTLEPLLSPAILGAAYYPEDAHCNPGKLTQALAHAFTARGGAIRTDARVTRIESLDGRVTGVRTQNELIAAYNVVVAAGLGSRELVAPFGVDLLVEPARGYHVTTNAAPTVRQPVRLVEAKSVASQIDSSLRITSKLDLSNRAVIPKRRVVEGIPLQASRYLRISNPIATGAWVGFRPLTPDGLPYIGKADALEHLLVATGHGQLGVSLAPITGVIIADLLAGSIPEFPLGPVSPMRDSRGLSS